MDATRPLVACCVLRNETEHAPRNTGAIGLPKLNAHQENHSPGRDMEFNQ